MPAPVVPPITRRTSWTSVLLNGKPIRVTSGVFRGSRGSWYRSGGGHSGIDIAAAIGTPVHTPLGGKVISTTTSGPYGNSVVILLSDGSKMRFAHLSKLGMSVGDRVNSGDWVGNSGASGNVTGAHLHFEIQLKSGAFTDPRDYLEGVKVQSPSRTSTRGGGGGSSSTSSSSGGGGGGGGGAVAGFSKKDYYRWLDAKFGGIAILRKMDAEARKQLGGKSIDWLIDILSKEKITDASIVASYMAQTGWFKKYGEEASRRLIAERQRPGLFREEVASYASGVKAELDRLGIKLSPNAFAQVTRNAYIFGWDAARALDEAQKMFSKTGTVTYEGGDIGEAQDSLEEAAWSLGVGLTQEDIRSMRTDVIDGNGIQSQLDDLRKRSASLYKVFAEEINAGKSLRQVASGYFEMIATMLELGSADNVDINDPLLHGGRAFATADPTTGKMVERGIWELEKDIRGDTRWLQTKNARDEMSSAGGNILKLMGLL